MENFSSTHCMILIFFYTPENRKQDVSWFFQDVQKETIDVKWVKYMVKKQLPTRGCSVTSVLKNFAKIKWKYLCRCLFFNKVEDFNRATLLKKRQRHWCLPENFSKFLRTDFILEHLRLLLLTVNLSNMVFTVLVIYIYIYIYIY